MRASAGAWLLAALPVAAVLAVDPSGLAPFGPLKWGLVSTLLLAAASVLCGRARPLVLARRAAWAWLGFLLAVATTAFGLDPLYAWIGTPERHFGALTWLLCAIAFLAGQQLGEREGRLRTVLPAGVTAPNAWAVTSTGVDLLGPDRGTQCPAGTEPPKAPPEKADRAQPGKAPGRSRPPIAAAVVTMPRWS